MITADPPRRRGDRSLSALRAIVARFGRPASVYLIASILTRVGFILLIPLYARRLDPVAYGDYVLGQTALSIAPALVLGLPAALTLFYFDPPAGVSPRASVGGLAKLLVLVTMAVFGVSQALVALFVPPSATGLYARWSLTCVMIAAAGSVVATVPVNYLRDAQRPLGAAAFQLAEFVLVVATGVFFVSTLGRGLAGALEALAVTYTVLGIASVVFIQVHLGGSISRALSGRALRFSLPYMGHFLAIWVQGVADRWTMKLAGFGESLGPYSLAGQLSSPATMVVNAWNLEQSARSGERYREAGLRGIRDALGPLVRSYAVAAVFPSALVLAGIPLWRLVVGPHLYGAFTYLPVLLAVSVVDALYHPSFQVVYYDSRSKWISAVTVTSAAASIALSAALVAPFGAWGALAARGAGSVLRTAVIALAARRCFLLARSGARPSAR